MGLLAKAFYNTGKWSAARPWASIFMGLIIVAIGSLGFVNFQSTADPQELWVPPESRANVEQTYFNQKFGAFFRINTGWITPAADEDPDTDLFVHPYLDMLYLLQYEIENNLVEIAGQNYSLNDTCYKPITGEGCLAESPMQYFHMDQELLESLTDEQIKQLGTCQPQSFSPPGRTCFDRIGTPVLTYAIFGGQSCYNELTSDCDTCIIKAAGMQMTFLLNKNSYSLNITEEWEAKVFIRNFKSFNYALGNDYHTDMTGPEEGLDYNMDLVKNLQDLLAQEPYTVTNSSGTFKNYINVKADYLAERSIEDNIKLESSQNSAIVLISYTLMFLYVSIAIGFFPSYVHMKFGLGAVGILVVIGALTSSIGLTFYWNQKLTMISAEVVPFLILAIGVDNMFLIARAEREVPAFVTEIEDRVAFAMKEIGPSIFTAAFCESLAFLIGMLTDVPALQNFCLVAGLGVITDFLLQMTIFVGALAIDNQRIKKNRADLICCCIKRENPPPRREEYVRPFFQKHYVPALFNKFVKILVLVINVFLVTIGVLSCYKILLGLNQNVSLVEGSDTFDYFETLYDYGQAGPPAYVVFRDVDYENEANLENMNLIAAQLATLKDTVLPPVYSWVSPFQNYISAGDWNEACGTENMGLGFNEQMAAFVNIKVESPCCETYGICGEQFSLDVIFDDDNRVVSTRFRFQHTTMKSQEDYIRGLLETRRACDEYSDLLTTYAQDGDNMKSRKPIIDIEWEGQESYKAPRTYLQQATDYLGLTAAPSVLAAEVHEEEAPTAFTYSLYYVYYDQYTYIRGVLFQNVAVGIGAIIISMQVLSSLRIACLISLCVFLVFFQLMGIMWMMNIVVGGYPIEMNAVFVVNLVTSLGFGVEFCNHIGMNFMRQTGTKEERAMKAMNQMGSSVIVGIASTKLLGVIVLAFAPSTLFKLYYFRMYLFIIILGAFNGLMTLPVLLSWIGPPTDKFEVMEAKNDLAIMKKVQENKELRSKGKAY